MREMRLDTQIAGITSETKLSDLSVPSEMRKRVKTGIDWWDTALGGGGHVPSTVCILTGTPGSGKSTLQRQLASSLIGQGHIVLYNTGEENLYQVKMATERLGIAEDFYVGQHIFVDNLLAHAEKLRSANPGKRMFLFQDSLQTLNDGYYKDGGTTGNTPVRCIEKVIDWCKSTYSIGIVINQVTKSGEFAGKQTIIHAVDARVHLYIDEDPRSPTYGSRVFEVPKNRWGCSGITTVLNMKESGLDHQCSYVKGAV